MCVSICNILYIIIIRGDRDKVTSECKIEIGKGQNLKVFNRAIRILLMLKVAIDYDIIVIFSRFSGWITILLTGNDICV
jgi:hypothetical protein